MVIKKYEFDDGKTLTVIYDEYKRALMSKEFVEQIVIPALEKQTAKKPQNFGVMMCTCPKCNMDVIKDKYCSNCGQALDWGE